MATTADEKAAMGAVAAPPRRHLDPNIPAEAHAWVDSLAPEEYQCAQARLKRKVCLWSWDGQSKSTQSRMVYPPDSGQRSAACICGVQRELWTPLAPLRPPLHRFRDPLPHPPNH
jgi:hypothetical protein